MASQRLHRTPVFILAPGAGFGRGTARAELLGRLAANGEQKAPVWPLVNCTWATPAALDDMNASVIHLVAQRSAAELWLLLPDPGSCLRPLGVPPDMEFLWREWCTTRNIAPLPPSQSKAPMVRVGTWNQWKESFARAGLANEWAAQTDVPGCF